VVIKRVGFKINTRTKVNDQEKDLKLRKILILAWWPFTHNIKNGYPGAQDGGIWHLAPRASSGIDQVKGS
jgi:hypothetical protein